MNSFDTDFWGIVNGMFITFAGLIALALFLFRWKRKDITILSFGLFCIFYGVRWLGRTQTINILLGINYNLSFADKFLSYVITIAIGGFFLLYFGKGIWRSVQLVFITIILYSSYAIILDITGITLPHSQAYSPVVVAAWCLVFAVNIVFIKREHDTELNVLRLITFIFLVTVIHDQVSNMVHLPWNLHLEPPGFFIFSIGLAYLAGHHFLAGERKLISIEQEIEIARQIQNSNLPTAVRVPPSIDLATRYVPASTIAGDFYDIHADEEKNVIMLIADVSGHGIGAALIGSMLKIALASQLKNMHDPGLVLTEINAILQGNIEYSFITACAVYLDLKKGKLIYANAGHPPPILRRGHENVTVRCSVHGSALGPVPGAVYQNETIDIGGNDQLILYTDGITETANRSGELFGMNRLIHTIETLSGQPAGNTADGLIESLVEWSGKRVFEDDLTLLVVDLGNEQ